ncbi:hypothetical protein JTB14_026177 [Gonioctena quinquepunctata]|nr:hypothetical protein JTB14_026177 [Gonioctena quinquepunctata]
MASKRSRCEDSSSDVEHAVVIKNDDFNENSKEERIKDEPVENESSNEYVRDIYLVQSQDEKWCTPEFVKLEELHTEDVDDNLKWEIKNSELMDSKSETGQEAPNEDESKEDGTMLQDDDIEDSKTSARGEKTTRKDFSSLKKALLMESDYLKTLLLKSRGFGERYKMKLRIDQ